MALTKDQHARVHECAEALRGQALQNLDDVLTKDEQKNKEFLTELDGLVFQCEACNWWCGTDELVSTEDDAELTCEECAE